MLSFLSVLWLTACGDLECTGEQLLVEDYCVECGDGGGCDKTAATCLEPCDDENFDCVDGARWPNMCD